VFVTGPRYDGVVGLVKQGDTWRVNRVGGRKHKASRPGSAGSRS
jgi:hypothetical protein